MLAVAQFPPADADRIFAQLQEVEQGLQGQMRKLRDRHMHLVQTRLFDNKTKGLIGGSNKELWKRFVFALEELLKKPGRKAAEAALDIASVGMAQWEISIRNWEQWVRYPGPNGVSKAVAERDAPDIAVIPKKAELVKEAYERETISLRSAKYVAVRPLHKSTIGKRAFERGEQLLHSRMTVTDTSTMTTWFEMMSLDRKRPDHYYVNHFFRSLIRLQDNQRQQNTKEYSLSDVVLYQLLSLEQEIDPAEIAMIELVDVDCDLIQWLGKQGAAHMGLDTGGLDAGKIDAEGIDAGSGIPWQDVPVDLFINETEQGGLVRELAHALGKEVRRAWSFEYLPYAKGGPAPEGAPATVSADAVRLDVLAFIAPALR